MDTTGNNQRVFASYFVQRRRLLNQQKGVERNLTHTYFENCQGHTMYKQQFHCPLENVTTTSNNTYKSNKYNDDEDAAAVSLG
eukprot:scaffold205742_cov63-Attheya_sp.AAC.4